MALPGAHAYWERYRLRTAPPAGSLPEVPEDVLVDFALNDLTPRDRALLGISLADPLGYERLKQEYHRRHNKLRPKLPSGDRP